MTPQEKQKLSESDICDLFITPAIKDAGWDQLRQMRREVTLTPGPVIVRGNMSSRNKKKKKFADYVLQWEPGVPIAIVEAKDNNHTVSHGMQQALGYTQILNVPSTFSSNGDAFASHNRVPEPGEDIETEFPLTSFPPPAELWKRYKKYRNIADDEEELVVEPYYVDPSGKAPRYYQAEAINRVMEAIAKGQKRLLLVMATGTGKTTNPLSKNSNANSLADPPNPSQKCSSSTPPITPETSPSSTLAPTGLPMPAQGIALGTRPSQDQKP